MPKTRERPEQVFIPGMEPPRVPAIDKAAKNYVASRDRRMAELRDETDARDTLISLMVEHRLVTYELANGLTVNLLSKQKVTVRRKGEEENGHAEE